MPNGADVQSIAGLREWLAALSLYKHDAEEAVSGTLMEIRRALEWIDEQLQLWQRSVRECDEAVVQAKAELAARRYAGVDGRDPDTTLQERNLRRAEAALEYSEEKVRTCRGWLSKLPKLVEETYTVRGLKLRNFLEGDLPRGLAQLGHRLESLERYAGERPDYATRPKTE